jgi:magnesium chelatase subunit D
MTHFPFFAIVGQEDMKLALILNGINPGIGGVLVSGAKGSGKSSAARGLANLLPKIMVNQNCRFGCAPDAPCGHCEGGEPRAEERGMPFVSLPIGATEDRVLGTIDLAQAMKSGEKRFDPGLLARVNRGVLYVDEVNLLPDHLVDILLDVAVSGVNIVEREGVSITHPASFVLIGTMNPEEGELRPQLLDRFSLCASVDRLTDPALRAEVVRRALEFGADPDAFIRAWAPEEDRLREKILRARASLNGTGVSDSIATRISELCAAERVEGLRADIVIRRCAMTLAAWEGRSEVTWEDVERVAEFALTHRRTPEPEPPPPPPRPKERGNSSSESDGQAEPGGQSRFDPAPQGLIRNPEAEGKFRLRAGAPGRRGGREQTGIPRGPYVRALPPKGKAADLAIDAILRAAAARQGRASDKSGDHSGGLRIHPEDLRVKVRRIPERRLFLVLLDASRSMGARRRMELTKGILIGLLDEAYQKRDEVGLIVFQGAGAWTALSPTRSIRRVQQKVRDLPVGGKTPLAGGLKEARKALLSARRRNQGVASSLILISDGRPTVGIGGLDPVRSAEAEIRELLRLDSGLLLVDTEEGPMKIGLMPEWGSRFGVPCTALEELHPANVRHLLKAG